MKDVDIDGTPPDEIAATLGEIRANHPADDPLHIFATPLRKWSNDTDTETAASFHQQLVENNEPAATVVFLSTQSVKQSFLLSKQAITCTPKPS